MECSSWKSRAVSNSGSNRATIFLADKIRFLQFSFSLLLDPQWCWLITYPIFLVIDFKHGSLCGGRCRSHHRSGKHQPRFAPADTRWSSHTFRDGAGVEQTHCGGGLLWSHGADVRSRSSTRWDERPCLTGPLAVQTCEEAVTEREGGNFPSLHLTIGRVQ